MLAVTRWMLQSPEVQLGTAPEVQLGRTPEPQLGRAPELCSWAGHQNCAAGHSTTTVQLGTAPELQLGMAPEAQLCYCYHFSLQLTDSFHYSFNMKFRPLKRQEMSPYMLQKYLPSTVLGKWGCDTTLNADNETGETQHAHECMLTLLRLQELVELLAFILHGLLLEVGPDLLNGEVGHVHFHQVQHLKDLPEAIGCTDFRSVSEWQ